MAQIVLPGLVTFFSAFHAYHGAVAVGASATSVHFVRRALELVQHGHAQHVFRIIGLLFDPAAQRSKDQS